MWFGWLSGCSESAQIINLKRIIRIALVILQEFKQTRVSPNMLNIIINYVNHLSRRNIPRDFLAIPRRAAVLLSHFNSQKMVTLDSSSRNSTRFNWKYLFILHEALCGISLQSSSDESYWSITGMEIAGANDECSHEILKKNIYLTAPRRLASFLTSSLYVIKNYYWFLRAPYEVEWRIVWIFVIIVHVRC